MQLTAAATLPEEKAGGPVTHRCEVRGVIPPWGVDRVTHVLRESLGGEFKARARLLVTKTLWAEPHQVFSNGAQGCESNSRHGIDILQPLATILDPLWQPGASTPVPTGLQN